MLHPRAAAGERRHVGAGALRVPRRARPWSVRAHGWQANWGWYACPTGSCCAWRGAACSLPPLAAFPSPSLPQTADFPVNCGGTNTDELLLGFIFFRCMSQRGGWVGNQGGCWHAGPVCHAIGEAQQATHALHSAWGPRLCALPPSRHPGPPLPPTAATAADHCTTACRLSPLGHVVPVGPAQCCKACLSGTVHPMNLCDDLNACSGHGVCNMRSCECFDGWTGADCSQVGCQCWRRTRCCRRASLAAG